jgi:DNA-binding GntR family transcriptional regulator
MEMELAQQLGISRSPVREALKRLSHEGLVTEIPHLGVTVSEVGLDSLHELYLIIGALEGLACREAAHLRSEATLRAIEQDLQAMDRAMLADDYQAWVQHNRDFHAHARKDCALPQLLRMLSDTQDRIHRFHVFQGAATLRARLSEPEHAAIFKAFCDGDGETAERLVRAHYMEGERVFKDYLRTISEDR